MFCLAVKMETSSYVDVPNNTASIFRSRLSCFSAVTALSSSKKKRAGTDQIVPIDQVHPQRGQNKIQLILTAHLQQ